jgi:hypothetical protein
VPSQCPADRLNPQVLSMMLRVLFWCLVALCLSLRFELAHLPHLCVALGLLSFAVNTEVRTSTHLHGSCVITSGLPLGSVVTWPAGSQTPFHAAVQAISGSCVFVYDSCARCVDMPG